MAEEPTLLNMVYERNTAVRTGEEITAFRTEDRCSKSPSIQKE
jgi:hypothetical protein